MAQKKDTVKPKKKVSKEEVEEKPDAKTMAIKKVEKPVKAVAEKPVEIGAEKPHASVEPVKVVREKDEFIPTINVEKRKSVLFVASESQPFISTGGLAEVIGSLPKSLSKNNNYDVRVVLPLYSDISKDYKKDFKFLGNIYVPLAWRNQYCGIYATELNGVTFYFIDNEYYFNRPGLYGYFDDAERYAFFSRSVIEMMAFLDYYPEIMHAHDWQTALSVIYLKTIYCVREKYRNIKTVFTIHNIEYQGIYSMEVLEDLFGISRLASSVLEYNGNINLMKGAIECSDLVSTVSPKYATEIQDPFFSKGLENCTIRNASKIRGILNGIDVDSYNPETDKTIFKNFTLEDRANKKACKQELQKMLNLPIRDDVPIIAVISRLVNHKGLDLVKRVMEELLNENIQFILLGKGDSVYENYFTNIQKQYNLKCVSIIAYNQDLSRKIYSGSDMFLMPSKMEPCGLSQMIASRYGTVPIVRETGGLFDSIKPFDFNAGNGFTFKNYNAHDMLYVIKQAISSYNEKLTWNSYVERAMKTDFSWAKSAKEYEKMYGELIK